MATATLDPELAKNPDQKVACLLLLDTSGSMEGERIDELSAGLCSFKEEVLKDGVASSRVDLCVITFDSEVKTIRDFGSVDGFEPPTLTAQNQTFLGSAILEALDKIEDRKETLQSHGIPTTGPGFSSSPTVCPKAKTMRRSRRQRRASSAFKSVRASWYTPLVSAGST